MKILVTGTTGFIGSHLIERLAKLDHDVYCFERYVTGRMASKHNFKTFFGDLRDYLEVSRAIAEIQPEVVIHLASISPVSYSYQNPFEIQEVNYNGTVKLAEACLRNQPFLKQFIFASTSETYGNIQPPMTEDRNQIPNSPYSASKIACEKYLLYLYNAFKFPATILRPFNTYGRKNDRHFFIESMITQMLTSSTVHLGESNIVRDFLYVTDHVNGYVNALGNEQSLGKIINLCTGKPFKLLEVAEQARKVTNFSGEILWHSTPARPYDIKELWGKNTLAKTLLDWEPEVSLEQGLKLTAEYWQSVLKTSGIKV